MPPAQISTPPLVLKAAPATALPVKRRVFSVAPYIGGIAVLAVLSALAWKFLGANGETTTKLTALLQLWRWQQLIGFQPTISSKRWHRELSLKAIPFLR